MATREQPLFEITLVGPGKSEPERLRCTDSEVIALENKGFAVTERTESTGKSAFVDASEALGRLLRHAELTGNADLLAKAVDAIQALLRGNKLMSRRTSFPGPRGRAR